LLKALPLLEEPADAEVDISRFLTQRLAAFVVSHMAQRYQRVATGESGVPIPGMCSAPDKATWDIPRNIVPFSVVIAQAAQLEFALGLDSLCEKQFARALETRNPATEFLLVTLAVKRSFRDASFGELPSLAVRQSRVVSAAKLVNNGSNVFANVETVSAENEPLDELAESLIFAGLAIGMLMGLEPAMVISEWRNRTDAVVLARCSLALERAHSAFSQSPIDAVLAIYDQAKPLVIRLAACSVLLNQKERSPAHTVNTQVLLLQIFRQCLSTETIVELLPKLATAYGQHWALHVDQHATLVQPRISVPPLRAIISAQPVHPGKHVAALIRAGCEAAGQRAYQPLLAWLNDLPT